MGLTPQDVRRLRALAKRLEEHEQWFQHRHGNPEPGSVRLSAREDVAVLRRVLAHLKAQKGDLG